MAHLYSNENFPLPVVEELRQFGHDVLTIQEAGAANQEIPDEEVLAFATSQNRAVLTINRKHFLRLHKASSEHAGIIVCTTDLDFKGQAHRIHEAIQAHDSLKGKLLRINRPPRP
jgi:predicted nuclease of predicted toxin-antitoxin system